MKQKADIWELTRRLELWRGCIYFFDPWRDFGKNNW